MRILVASHTYTVDLNCEKLRAIATLEPDIDVTVVVPRCWQPGGVQAQTIISQPSGLGSFRIVPCSNFSQNHQGLLCFGADLIALVRQFRPQIIQVEQGTKSLAYAELITLNRVLKLEAKNLFFTWWNLPYALKFPIASLEAYNLRHTDGAIAGNRDAATILQQRGYRGAVQVLPQLGVDVRRFYPQPQPQLRAELGIRPDEFVVGYVGRFVAEKGLLTVAKALAGLRDYEWRWLLVGRGDLKARLMQQATEFGIGDRLIWVESVPHAEVPRYLNAMDALVLASQTTNQVQTLTASGWKEQFGHVLIEAMACRVPVIGSDSGEIPHVIGKAGLIFPEGNADALRDQVRSLLHYPDQAANLAQQGYERAIAHYTNHVLARQQLDFYKSLWASDTQ